MNHLLLCSSVLLVALGPLAACSDDGSQGGLGGDDGEGSGSSGSNVTGGSGSTINPGSLGGTTSGNGNGGGNTVGSNIGPQVSELWYASGDKLVYIEIDAATGEVADIQSSDIAAPHGQNAITMVEDGSLLGARLVATDETKFYLIEDPPRDGGAVDYVELGTMPDDIGIEGLYTDCAGRLYAMDTGSDDTNSDGNRLLIFTGDVLAGDFSYEEVSDLSKADVADIDDLGPGLTEAGELRDNPGIAIDTGNLYVFNYETGTGTKEAEGGRFGIHVLGGPLFDDGQARVYVLDGSANLRTVDVNDGWKVSDSLGQGPQNTASSRGHSGLTGPLTNCTTTFTHQIR